MVITLKLVLLALTAGLGVESRPQNSANATIKRYDFNLEDSGEFQFSVETSDGFHHDVQGYLENIGTNEESLVVSGSYSYTGPDGEVYAISYLADENGFQPLGRHIPQSVSGIPSGISPPTTSSPGTPETVTPEIQALLPVAGVNCVASLCGTGLG